MMELIRNIRGFMTQPYPECRGVINYLRTSLLVGVFIGSFLFVFEPFGMENAGADKAWYCFMYGAITFGVCFGADLIMRYLLQIHRDDESWVFWKWMLSTMIVLVAIATSNYLFMWVQEHVILSAAGFFQMLLATVLIGAFPVFFSGMMNSRRLEKSNKLLAQEIQHNFNNPTSELQTADKSHVNFEIDPSQLLYVEAMQNYVVVHYHESDSHKQKIIRSTLRRVEEKLRGTAVQRTHRSFLINRDRITSVSGNAQGLKLQLDGIENKYIPVSRKYIPQFR